MVDQDAHKDENMKDVNEKAEKQEDRNQKDESQEDEIQKQNQDVNQKEEHSMHVLEGGSDALKDQNKNKIEDSVPGEKLSSSLNGECMEKSLAAKEPDVVVSDKSQSSNSDLPNDCPPNSGDKSEDLMPKAGLLPVSMKGSGDGASGKDHSQQSEEPKDVDTVPDSLPVQTKEPQQSLTNNTLVENGANTGILSSKFSCRVRE